MIASPTHERIDVGRRGPRPRRRRGQSLLEVQVAFAVLGIGLAGLSQLVVMQIRQVRVLENRLQGQVGRYDRSSGTYPTMRYLRYDSSTGTYIPTPMGQTFYYLVPWQNPWTRKLAGTAQIVAGSPSIPGDPSFQPSGQTPSHTVYIQSVDATESDQSVTAIFQLDRPTTP